MSPDDKVSKYVTQKLTELQGETGERAIIVETSTPLYQKWTDQTTRRSVRT